MRAAHDIATNGLPLRGLSAWIARARTSLPVPLSPRTRIVDGLRAAVFASSSVARSAGLFVTKSWKTYSFLSAFRRFTFSRTSACCATIFSTTRLTSSGSKGLTT